MRQEKDSLSEDFDITPLYRDILAAASAAKASDVHFEPFETHVNIRFRAEGRMVFFRTVTKEEYDALFHRILFISGIDVLASGASADGRYSEAVAGTQYNIRVSVLPVLYGQKIVLRLLRKNTQYNMKNIGLSAPETEIAERIIRMTGGLVLVAGPTGSGKTTTLYSFLQELNRNGLNITTIEDPIEYDMDGINQSQVNPRTGFTFAAGLKTILRQDPDVIMIGEIRDEETAKTAVSAAISGKLVFATIHTGDSIGTVSRLINMGVKPYLLSEALIAVFSQRLINIITEDGKPVKRSAVYEIYLPSERARQVIGTGRNLVELREIAAEEGFRPLRDKIRTLYEHRRVAFEDLIKLNQEDFL